MSHHDLLSYIELNRASRERLQALIDTLTDEDFQVPVGEHWTVASTLAHLAFLDRRALYVLEATQFEGEMVNPDWHIFVNDVVLPFMAAIPPKEAARLAVECAEAVDKILETYPPYLLNIVHAEYKRYIFRAYHRNEHLDEIEAALKKKHTHHLRGAMVDMAKSFQHVLKRNKEQKDSAEKQ